MALSVIDPISPSIERTKQILFRPFDLGKWFLLGFTAFLATLGQGGGSFPTSFNSQFPAGGGGVAPPVVAPPVVAPPPKVEMPEFLEAPRPEDLGALDQMPGPEDLEPDPDPEAVLEVLFQEGQPEGVEDDEWREVLDWARANMGVIVVVGVILMLVFLSIGLVITWLKARGQFMFIDGIVSNRGAVAEPWREFRTEGNSLFVFAVVLGLASFLAFATIVGLGIAVAWPDIQARQFDRSAILALIGAVPFALLLGLTMAVVNAFLYEFVVPIMYLRRLRVMSAWGVFRRELLAEHKLLFAGYLLFRVVIHFVVGLLSLAGTCLSCCLAALPYIGTVILLPLYVFSRTYPLEFLAQFGPDWDVFAFKKPSGPITDNFPEFS